MAARVAPGPADPRRRLTIDLTPEAIEARAGIRLGRGWTGSGYVRRDDGDTSAGVRFERRW